MIIKGNTVGTTMPRANWDQADPNKADYIKGKEAVDEAIQATQEAVSYAQNAADDAQATADDALAAANDAQEAADQAQATAEDAQVAADDAWDLADSKAEMRQETFTLFASQWQNNKQVAQSRLVDMGCSVIIVTPAPESGNYQAYTECGVRCTGDDGEQGLIFVCENVPNADLTVNAVGFL